MRKHTAGIVAGLTTTAITLALAGPAHAGIYSVDDADDSPHGSDIYTVGVTHTAKKLTVVTDHDNLRKSFRSAASLWVFIDTDKSDKGPEYVVSTDLFTNGGEYNLYATEGFARSSWVEEDSLPGVRVVVDTAAESARTIVRTAALGHPDEVRVSIRAKGKGPQSIDWVGPSHSWSLWVDNK